MNNKLNLDKLDLQIIQHMMEDAEISYADLGKKLFVSGGTIHVRWWGDEAGAHLSVEDSGIGIEQKHLPRLTERFYRVDSSRASSTGGTGLGLAIVKHVLLRHQGRLDITSAPGRGSCFSCHFPTAQVPGR